jgi:hypothetical protein
MEVFTTGEPFPIGLPTGRMGLYPLLAEEGSLVVPLMVRETSTSEVHKFSSSSIRIGAFGFENVPFFLVRVEGALTMDGPLNPYQYEEEDRQEFVEGDGNAVHLCLVEGRKHIIRGQRMVGADPEVMNHLKEVYRRCMKKHKDHISVNRAQRRAYQAYEKPKAMLEESAFTQVFPGKPE